jgi:adenylate kinase family enzyme
MVAARLAEPDTTRGYIFDGYPRTLAAGALAGRAFASEAAELRNAAGDCCNHQR